METTVIEIVIGVFNIIWLLYFRKLQGLQAVRNSVFGDYHPFHRLEHPVDVYLLAKTELAKITSFPFIHVLVYHRFVIDNSCFLRHILSFLAQRYKNFRLSQKNTHGAE